MTVEKPEPPRAYKRILLIKPSSLGDIVHALPVLAVLREAYPQAHIAWLAGNSFAPLLQNHPLLDEVIPFDRARYGKMLRSPRIFWDFIKFLGEIRRRRFDLVIDLQGLIRSGFLSFASGAQERVGFRAARELAWIFYNRRVRCSPDAVHAVEQNLRVAAALGLKTHQPQFPLGLRPEETRAARDLLTRVAGRSLDGFTAVIPGARWASKQWRPDRLADLIDRLQAADFPPCVLLGAPADRGFTDQILAARRSTGLSAAHGHAFVIDLVGRTNLRELTALLDLSERVICHDSGPMHIAAALNKPLVALFGPTDPARTGPYSPLARVVTHPVECAPCFKQVCPLKHHACLEQLEIESVLQKIRDNPPLRAGAADLASASVKKHD